MGEAERHKNRKNPIAVDSTIDYRGEEGTIVDTDRRLKRPLEIYLPMISLTFLRNRGIFPSVIRRIQKSGDVGMASHWASGLYKK